MYNPANPTLAAVPIQNKLLDLDKAICNESLGRHAFVLSHRLVGHPLLTLEALARLADGLPAAKLECLPAVQDTVTAGAEPRPLPKPSETVLGIENNGCWMVMKNVEQNPEYGDLLDSVLDEMTSQLPQREGQMRLREAFIFLSAPAAITPVHIDPEHNMLLHVHGSKQFHVGSFEDRQTEHREIYRYCRGGHRNLAKMPRNFKHFDLTKGSGIYVPPWRPHWVKNGPTYGISISVTFRTQRSERYEYAHRVNNKLQRFGLSPRPPGELEWLDELKANYVRFKQQLRRLARAERFPPR